MELGIALHSSCIHNLVALRVQTSGVGNLYKIPKD